MLVNQLSKQEISAIFFNKYLYDITRADKLATVAKQQAGIEDVDTDRSTLHSLQRKIYRRIADIIAEGFTETILDPIITLGDTLESIEIATRETIAELDPEDTTEKHLINYLKSFLSQITSQLTAEYSKNYYSRERISQTLQLVLSTTEVSGETYTDLLSDKTYEEIMRQAYSIDEALEQVDVTMCALGDPEEIIDAMVRPMVISMLTEAGIPEAALELMDLEPFIEDAKSSILPQFRAYFSKIEDVLIQDINRIYA